MSVVDLRRRATVDWDLFCKCVKSSHSLIFFDSQIPAISDPPGSLDFCVGSRWYDPTQNTFYSIEDSGLQINSQSGVVIEVSQRIALPYNVLGIVMGKGRYIFQSAVISPGKVDPGFDGKLRIGFYNASRKAILLQRDEPFCSCCFFGTDAEADNPRRREAEPFPQPHPLPKRIVVGRFFAENWKSILPVVVSTLALIVSLGTYLKK